MAQKSSVYLTDETLAVLRATAPKNADFSLSGRINSIAERYGEIVGRECPTFTESEWCAICDANNGTILDDLPQTTAHMWANVADSPGIGEKWGIDAARLVSKMRKLRYVETVAVAEIVQRFWSDCSRGDNAAWLAECGAKIHKEQR